MRRILTAWESTSQLGRLGNSMQSTTGIVIRTERTDSSFTIPKVVLNSNFYKYMYINILPSDYRWYISNSNSTDYVEGNVRSFLSGHIIYPKLEWEYFTINIINCTTYRYKFPHLIIDCHGCGSSSSSQLRLVSVFGFNVH